MNEQLQAIVTMLSLVNPAICAAMFTRATADRSPKEKMADATRAAIAILFILSAAALVGMRLLHLFGVSLDAFMVAGGGVLAWMGFSMLSRPRAPPDPKTGPSLTPLILFAASPGSITGVITLSAAHTRLDFPLTSLVAVATATACTWLVLILAARFRKEKAGPSFIQDTTTRFMGLIVLAMGIQFALTGFHAFSQHPAPPLESSSSLDLPAGYCLLAYDVGTHHSVSSNR
jgi:multiple antibiotic resistance protein